MDDDETVTNDENTTHEAVIVAVKEENDKTQLEFADASSLKEEDTKSTLVDLPTSCIPHQFIILPPSAGNSTHISGLD